jgi:hypothetical protein
MTDLIDQLRKANEQQKDLIDRLSPSIQKNFEASKDPESLRKAMTVQHLQKVGSPAGAFFSDMGAAFNKIMPNLKRVIDPDNKEAMAELKEIEDFQDTLRTAFPSAVFGGEVAAPASAAIPTMGVSVPAAVGLGAIEAAGFTPSESDPRVSAAIAGILPFVPDAFKKSGSAIGEFIESAARRTGDILTASPDQQAGRVLKRFMDEIEVNPEDILKQRGSLGEGATLADVQELEGLAQGAAITPQGRQAMSFFENRQVQQQSRIKDKLSRITGKKAENFTGDLGSFINQRAESAKPLYDKAFQADFIPSDDFDTLFKRIRNSGALKKASDIAKIEGRQLKSDSLNYTDLHSMKMALDDLIGAEAKKGGKNKVTALTKLKQDLLDEIEGANPDYKLARMQFSGDSGVINAAELGADIFNPKKMGLKISNEQLKEEVKRMSADEFTAFQGGMTKAVSDKIADIPETADAARRLWSRPKVKEALSLAFENKAQFDTFLDSLNKETRFTDTLRKLYQGSQTAQRQAGQSALKTGEIAALEPFKKVLRGEVSPEGMQSLSRLMFDPSVSNAEIRKTMIEAGIINETASAKAIAAMRKKWGEVWSRSNLPSVNLQQKTAISSVTAPLYQGEEQ